MIPRTKYMSEDELQKLRVWARTYGTPLQWLLVDMATQTGLRVSELTRLRAADVDFDLQALIITRSKKRTAASPELLPITPSLAKHLEEYLAAYPRDAPNLWRGQRGSYTTRGLQQNWKACCKKAGLPQRYSIHSARHTMAVRLLRTSKNLRLVQKQLGHSSPTTTANMYADVPFEDWQAALTTLFEP